MKGLKNTAEKRNLNDVLGEIPTENLLPNNLFSMNGIIMWGKVHCK
jgi:hypothetical protein